MDDLFPASVTSFPELLRERARLHGDRVACVFLSDDHSARIEVSYARLDLEARKIAARLQETMQPGDRAILLFPPGPGFYYAFLGCLYSGVIPVPAYPPNRPSQTNHAVFQRFLAILADAAPSACLCDAALLQRLKPVATGFDEARGLDWIATEELDDARAADWRPYAPVSDQVAFLQYTSGSTAKPRGVMVSHGNLVANEIMMMRSFGHGEDCVMASWLPFYHDMGLIGNFMQVIFVGGLTVLMPPFRFLQKPLRWLRAATEYRATILAAPNFAYKFCAEKIAEEEKAALDLSSLDIAVVSAEPIHAATLDQFAAAFAGCGFRRSAFFPAFGLAEGTLMSTGSPRAEPPIVRAFDRQELEIRHRARPLTEANVDLQAVLAMSEDQARVLVGSGTALEGMEIRVVDPETRRERSPGVIGEIWMRGAAVALGYRGRDEDNEVLFQARIAGEDVDPDARYLRTGDFGFYLDGELFVTGRLKDLMIIRGANIYPQDVEATVEAAHELLVPGAGAVFSLPAAGGERLVAVHEVSRHFREEMSDEVLNAARRAISEQHDIPPFGVVLIRVGTLPKTSSGKIRRSACRELYTAGELNVMAEWHLGGKSAAASVEESPVKRAADFAAPRESAPAASRERELAAWIRERIAVHLEQEPAAIDFDLPFADIGLDSVVSAQLMGELEEHLGLSLSETLPFDYGNIRALARGVLHPEDTSAAGQDQARAAKAVQTPEAAAPSPAPKASPATRTPPVIRPNERPAALSENVELNDILAEMDSLSPDQLQDIKHALKNDS